MSESFIESYKAKHQHPLNRLTHSIGIPMIVVSLPLFLFNWRWALPLLAVGWALQFIGHAIEGNRPAFFKNPMYLLVGPWWPGSPGSGPRPGQDIAFQVMTGANPLRFAPLSRSCR